MLSPFQGEYKYIPTLNMLIYSQPMSLDRVGEGDSNSICCGRLCGLVKAYKYKEKLYVEIETIDDDDLDYYCSVEVDDEYSQRKLFCETVNVLRDHRFYKIWNVWEFYREHLLESVDRVFIMEEMNDG